jgi:predicted regulator of Ras-like GTPase activity (Roadblock/LC7/MglB family)
MNVQKLNQCVENLKRDLGDGLLATSIVSNSDGLAIASHNSSPKAAAIFASITESISNGLAKGPYPPLGKYYILDLCDNKMLLFLPLGDYQWGIALDSTKVKLGLLLNIVLPEMVSNFEAAMTE